MCIFSFDPRSAGQVGPISVGGTKIFVRGLADGRQALVYSMNYSSQVDMAMVLPLPTPSAPREDAVEFIDLSGYDRFFEDMDKGFPTYPGPKGVMLGVTLSIEEAPPRILEVHNVGSFEASFVPTSGDFSRLDSRFRLPDGVLDALPIYRDYSFAVFKLKSGARKAHPMAFSFPRRNAKELFFPTVHVHDGTVPQEAQFDHTLYSQFQYTRDLTDWSASHSWQQITGHPAFDEWFHTYAKQQRRPIDSYSETEKRLVRKLIYDNLVDFVEAPANASQYMEIDRAKGLVQGDALVRRMSIVGPRANKDLVFSDE